MIINPHDQNYFDMANFVLKNGVKKNDRTGTGVTSTFIAPNYVYDLRNGFPLLTTKKVHWPSVVHELLWFLKGTENVSYLEENKCTIWREWYTKDLYGRDILPATYGIQWRRWPTIIECNNRACDYDTPIDQLQNAIDLINNNPYSRRILVTAWNPADLEIAALPWCHNQFQMYVEGEFLDLKLYQRSCDTFLGAPFNIASYSLLLSMIAQITGKTPRYFIHSLGDLHIYDNHLVQINEQLTRTHYEAPKLILDSSITNIDDFKFEHINLLAYEHHPAIKANVAV